MRQWTHSDTMNSPGRSKQLNDPGRQYVAGGIGLVRQGPEDAGMPIADSVKLGKDVTIFHPALVNLYGCTVGDDTRIGAFVEIQKNAVDRRPLQDLVAHLHLRRRGDRGRGLRRPRRDVHQRPLPAGDQCRTAARRPRPTGRSSRRASKRGARSVRTPRSSAASPSAWGRWLAPAPWSPSDVPDYRDRRRRSGARHRRHARR